MNADQLVRRLASRTRERALLQRLRNRHGTLRGGPVWPQCAGLGPSTRVSVRPDGARLSTHPSPSLDAVTGQTIGSKMFSVKIIANWLLELVTFADDG